MARQLSESGGLTGESSTIKVEGLTETLTNLRKLGIATEDLKDLNFNAGVIVAKKVQMPVDDGDMLTTLRVQRAVKKAAVVVGRKSRGWYATFLEYGTKHIEANPFLLRAADSSQTEVYAHYEQGIQQLINKFNLGEG